MNRSDLVTEIAERTGLPRAAVQRVLKAQGEVALEVLARGESVTIPGLGSLGGRWQEARTLRTVHDQRKMILDGRFIPRFRSGKAVRDVLLARTPQLWKDPAHQAAWRVSETLVGDLSLYHKDKAPSLDPNLDLDAVKQACEAAFGPIWTRVVTAYETQVAASIRATRPYLLLSARRRWSARG